MPVGALGCGVVVRGCLVLAVQCDGAEVTTIEGLTESGEILIFKNILSAVMLSSAVIARQVC